MIWLTVPRAKRTKFIDEFLRIYAGISSRGGLQTEPVSDDSKDGDHILVTRIVNGKQRTQKLLRVSPAGKLVPEGPLAIKKRLNGTVIPSIYRDLMRESCREIIATI